MSKTDRAAARRRANERRIKLAAAAQAAGIPAIAPTPKRERDGHMHRTTAERDPARNALMVRCGQMGAKPTAEAIRDARSPWWGCEAGKMMAGATRGHRARSALWDAIQHMRRVQAAYDRACGAPNRHAQSLRLLLPIEAMEADADSPPPDDRTDEAKSRDAVTAWMQLQGWLGWTDGASASIALRCVIDDMPTTDGAGLVSALRCVADGMAGNRMVYRGRDKSIVLDN